MWCMYQASLERRAILETLSTKARAKLSSIFETEANGLEKLIGFKIPEWNSESIQKQLSQK